MVIIVRILTNQKTTPEVKKISGIYSITVSSETLAFLSPPLNLAKVWQNSMTMKEMKKQYLIVQCAWLLFE
jgi:hypothetical protein